MIVFPHCKINLGLHILRKREDGFHDLETVFYPLPLHDALEVVHHPSLQTDVEFSASGLEIKGSVADNLCVQAYDLLKKEFSQLPPVKMHLHKTIPMGAGLGGGSADGAFALRLLNEKFKLGLDREQLIKKALQLGSDCPFFIETTACLGSGRGEVLEPMSLDLSAYKYVLVNPGIHINTGWAFAQLTPSLLEKSLKEIIQLPIAQWKHSLTNDFENPVSSHYPAIAGIKEKLYEQGALYASMTGSGSTVYGIFEKDAVPTFSFPPDYFVKIL